MPVELDVRHLLDRAVRGQHAVLVLAAEQRDFDLLALVLVRVVLDSRRLAECRMATWASRPYLPLNALPVWSRCGLGIVASGENAEPDRVQRPLRPTSWLGTNPKTMR